MGTSYFESPRAVDAQIEKLRSEGNTVYIGRGVHKIKHGNDTIEFNTFFRYDSVLGRPIVDGGFYATSDPEIIKRIDSMRELSLKRFAPIVTQSSLASRSPEVVVEEFTPEPVAVKTRGR